MSENVTFCPQPKQIQFLESSADITIFGGAAGGGKTFSLLYEPFHDIHNPLFNAVMLRRTYPQIYMVGGLWDCSEEIYPYAGGVPSKGNGTWTFPSGATVSFRAMEHEDDRYKFDGAQIPLISWDQLESFTQKQFFYLMSRNRSMSGAVSRIRASANPQPGWLADFLQWWWEPKTGYAIPERSGKTRWFVRIGDSIKWADKKSQLVSKYPGCLPKSVSFILSKLQDNKILMDKDPGYLASLMALPLVDRERLLGGNWKIAIAGNIFRREWWKFVDVIPEEIESSCRFWDFAATEPEPGKDPDYTAGVRIAKARSGNIYVQHSDHFQASPLGNETRARATAQLDGTGIRQRMEQEPGASGKAIVDHYARSVFFGFDFAGKPSLKKKVLRWAPLSAACEHGRVFLVRGDWNAGFVDELEGCKGEDEKNDQCLIAGTKITCKRGDINIENVIAGDLVMTRQGWKEVDWAGLTGYSSELIEIEAANGSKIVGTKKHLVFSASKGFICMDAASGSLELLCIKHTNRNGPIGEELSSQEAIKSSSTARPEERKQNGQQGSGQGAKDITETSGSPLTEESQKEWLFTIKTGIKRITPLRTFSLLPEASILPSIEKEATGNQECLAQRQGQTQPNGMEARMELPGTERMPRSMDSVSLSQSSSSARIAESYSLPEPIILNAAVANALGKNDCWTLKTKSALFAANVERNSSGTRRKQIRETRPRNIAELNAGARCFKELALPVYNLKVKGCPEFFANGILVHNCDSASGALEELAVGTGAFGSTDDIPPSDRPDPLGLNKGLDFTTITEASFFG